MKAYALAALLAVGCRNPLTEHGAVLHVERGEEFVVRDTLAISEYDLRWRAVGADRSAFGIVRGTAVLPEALSGDDRELRVRFAEAGNGIAVALLDRRTEFTVDHVRIHAVLVRTRGTDQLFPVAHVRFEGALSTQRWIESVCEIEADPAPGRDLLDGVADASLRMRLGRGVDRAVALGYLSGPVSTWELAAVERDGKPVPDWEACVRSALHDGRFGSIEGLIAVIRRNSVGRPRGKRCYAVPLSHVVFASMLEQDGHTWSWSGVAYVQMDPADDEVAPLPEGLPKAALRVELVRDRSVRSGLSPLAYAIVKPLSAAYAYVVMNVLAIANEDAWAEKWDEWESLNRQGPSSRPQ